MRRGSSGRVGSAAKVAAVLVLALATSACARGAETTTQATPIPGDADLSFADLMSVRPSPSPSASPSASPASTGTRASSSSNGSRPSSGGAPAAAKPASGPANCPSGRVTGEYLDFTVSKVADASDGDPAQWRAQATGTVLNETARPVRDIRVTVTLHTDSAEADSEGMTIGGWLGKGTSADWRVVFDEYESNNEPEEDDVSFSVSGWSWGESSLAQCPTPGFSS